MPLGYCNECKCLKAIRPVALQFDGRTCDWAPVEHDAPPTHRNCGGVIEQTGEGPADFACSECGSNGRDGITPIYSDEVERGRCLGSGRPIR